MLRYVREATRSSPYGWLTPSCQQEPTPPSNTKQFSYQSISLVRLDRSLTVSYRMNFIRYRMLNARVENRYIALHPLATIQLLLLFYLY